MFLSHTPSLVGVHRLYNIRSLVIPCLVRRGGRQRARQGYCQSDTSESTEARMTRYIGALRVFSSPKRSKGHSDAGEGVLYEDLRGVSYNNLSYLSGQVS